jgi:outer membrane protein|uniref:TolC family protein n=1 Tax=Desulfobacca acetoxidans TaxID=60893 RepID=A0A7V6A4P9_9BACT
MMLRISHRISFILGLALLLSLAFGWPGPGGAQDAGPRLSLQEAINLALKQNPAIKEAKAKLTSAQEQIGVSRAGLMPRLGFAGNYYYGTAFSRTPGFLSATTPSGISGFPSSLNNQASNYYIYRFTLNQLIYDFGKTPGQVAGSKATFQQAGEELAGTRQQVVLDTRTAYYGYLSAWKALKVAAENVRQNQELLNQAQGFYREGLRARIDVAKAEANLAEAEAALIRAKNLVETSRVGLMTVLGLKTWPFGPVEDILETEVRLPPLDELKAQALNQRPEILRTKYRQEGDLAAIKVARAGYYPSLNSQASYGWEGPTYPLPDSWWLGVTLNVPLFEGLGTTYALRQAKANLRASKANAEALALDIRRQVEQNYLDVKAAGEVIRAARKAREAAAENLRLAAGRYKSGVGNIIEVTDAQVQFAQADLNYVRALYDFKVAEAKLDKAVGRSFQESPVDGLTK